MWDRRNMLSITRPFGIGQIVTDSCDHSAGVGSAGIIDKTTYPTVPVALVARPWNSIIGNGLRAASSDSVA